jgi:hypothetical protein
MPLIHIQDLETMANHLRANIVKYMLETHNITFLDDNTERDLYNFILLTTQNYVVNPPTIENHKDVNAQSFLCLFTKGLCFYTAFALTIFAFYCLRAASTTV